MTDQQKIQLLLETCKYALDAVEDSELYPQDATDKLSTTIDKIEND